MNESSPTRPTHGEIFGTTTNPCPAWCTLPDGHGYDATGYAPDGSPDAWEFRLHERTFPAEGSEGVDLTQGERLWSDGRVELVELQIAPPEVCREGLTGPQARAVADALRQAADLWDAVVTSGDPA